MSTRDTANTQITLERLYEDALEIYERAWAEVTIPRSDCSEYERYR